MIPIFLIAYKMLLPSIILVISTTGVAYITDKSRGNCSAVPIETTGFDVKNADAQHVRIRTTKEFFDFDKTSYIYEGQVL